MFQPVYHACDNLQQIRDFAAAHPDGNPVSGKYGTLFPAAFPFRRKNRPYVHGRRNLRLHMDPEHIRKRKLI
jgi:hypothetical protein